MKAQTYRRMREVTAVGHTNATGTRADDPADSSPFQPEAFAGGLGEGARSCRGDGHAVGVFKLGLGAFRIRLRLIAWRPKGDDALFRRRIVQIGDAGFYRLVEALHRA